MSRPNCFYCSRPLYTLKENSYTPPNFLLSRDHILPRSRLNPDFVKASLAISKYWGMVNNFRISCVSCNGNRAVTNHCHAAMLIYKSYPGGWQDAVRHRANLDRQEALVRNAATKPSRYGSNPG